MSTNIYCITCEHNAGTRFQKHYNHVYVFARSRSDAISKFNSYHRHNNKDCYKVSTEKLPKKVSDLPLGIHIKKIDVLGLKDRIISF